MRRFAVPYAEPRPFSQLNITPLIDVLLVLLIIFILSVPAATHKVDVDLPGRGTVAAPPETHRLHIAASGALALDGVGVSEATLPARLAAIAARDGVLQLQTDADARYERFDTLLATIKGAGITRLGFVGNERFGRW